VTHTDTDTDTDIHNLANTGNHVPKVVHVIDVDLGHQLPQLGELVLVAHVGGVGLDIGLRAEKVVDLVLI